MLWARRERAYGQLVIVAGLRLPAADPADICGSPPGDRSLRLPGWRAAAGYRPGAGDGGLF
ncbi:hypothetical protein [Paenibacillus typhae]|uniref:hypothetical protein n=1 Tax=Paenibacillus typhae TaxID=1174501 RepID=UPI001113FE39|nr:hypothetical protein [Paenibacillus typhae]